MRNLLINGKAIVFLAVLSVTILISCKRYDKIGENIPIEKEGFFFDTIITISVYGENKDLAESAINDCFSYAKEIENKLSNKIATSEVSNINKFGKLKVSEETKYVIKKGIEYGKISKGAFDITMGNVTALWDFNNAIIPDQTKLLKESSFVDYNKIFVKDNEVSLSDTNVSIDLGGIAKGYIADKMKEIILKRDIDSAIINLGGNVITIGKKPDGNFFKIGIQDPFSEDSIPIIAIDSEDYSIVTSGTYQRYFKIGDVLYHHILDKNSGLPVRNGLCSVSIINDSSIDADALSTTCFLLGSEEGMKLIESLDNTEAIFIHDNGAIEYSSGMGDTVKYKLVN